MSQDFPPTEWSLLDLINDETQQHHESHSLERLLAAYLPALRTYLIHNRGCQRHEADDVVQAFVYRKILRGQLLQRVTRGKGKFRSFLTRSLDRFHTDQRRSALRQRRHPGQLLSLDEPATTAADNAAGGDDPGDIFTAAWARQVIADALDRMRRHCDTLGRTDVWMIFEARIVRPALHGEAAGDYDELVKQLGMRSVAQASNVLVTGRRMFERYLREVVSQFVTGEGQIEEELRDLRSALARVKRGK